MLRGRAGPAAGGGGERQQQPAPHRDQLHQLRRPRPRPRHRAAAPQAVVLWAGSIICHGLLYAVDIELDQLTINGPRST